MTVLSLVIYFIAMLAIGLWSYYRTKTLSDYMLAGRRLGPAVTALSAGASDMSGWLVMGLPGALYVSGISNLWLPLGLTVGAYLNYVYLAPRLRMYTEIAGDSLTIPDYLENRFEDGKRILRVISGLVIFVFFIFYTSSGMVSGGVLFESAFQLDYRLGLFITAGVVILYTLLGGFVAVSFTDFVQGTIMFLALVLVPIVAFTSVGGYEPIVHDLNRIDPSLLDIFKGTSFLGILSLLAWGLGYFGQPHIIVRFMAIKSVRGLKIARRIGIGWMIVTLLGASLTGLIGISYISRHGGSLDNPETIFIALSTALFHPFVAGFVLAAIMSTISSQLLVTASSVTEDFYRTFFRRSASNRELVLVSRISVLLVAVCALLMSLTPNQTILLLVSHAWAGFGASFGPVILISLFWRRMNVWGALAGMITGGITVIVWVSVGLSQSLYEIIPGFILSTLAVFAASLLTEAPSPSIRQTFARMVSSLQK